MRRFLLAWTQFGCQERYRAYPVTYVDDVVLCCEPGYGAAACATVERLMGRLGLTVTVEKTQTVRVPEVSFDFLGYTLGRLYGKNGRCYIATTPSNKSVKRLRQAIHDATSPRWSLNAPAERVARINRLLRGWSGYFNQGPVIQTYKQLQDYTNWRVRRWLLRRRGLKGNGYRRYPDAYLHDTLGLYRFPRRRADLPSAKA